MAAGDCSQIYTDLMRFKPEGMTPNAWAMKAGVSRTVWADMRRHGNPSRRTLDKLLTAAGSSLAEFEALRLQHRPFGQPVAGSGLADRAHPWVSPNLPGLPLLASSIGGEWGGAGSGIELTELRTAEIVEKVPRPATLANDPAAYAITILGDSMWPRFRPGRRIAISPRAAVAIGDDVLVKLKHRDDQSGLSAVLIKELQRKSSSGVELRQFKPDTTFHVPLEQIDAIEKVMGELI